MDELSFEGKKFISSKRAAEVTGYAQDYVGQLSRMGKISGRRVGRSWYVDEEELRKHRLEETAVSHLHRAKNEEVSVEAGSEESKFENLPALSNVQAPETSEITNIRDFKVNKEEISEERAILNSEGLEKNNEEGIGEQEKIADDDAQNDIKSAFLPDLQAKYENSKEKFSAYRHPSPLGGEVLTDSITHPDSPGYEKKLIFRLGFIASLFFISIFLNLFIVRVDEISSMQSRSYFTATSFFSGTNIITEIKSLLGK